MQKRIIVSQVVREERTRTHTDRKAVYVKKERRKTMKKLLTILLAALMLLSVVACSRTTVEEAAAPATEPHEVRTDINLVNQEVLVSLDIMQTNKTFTRSVLVQVYEGLTVDNEDGTWDYLLADNISVSDDSLVYTVKLKQGVIFHNGDEMKANDVAFSLNRAISMPFLAAYCGSIDHAEVVDDYTVTIYMKAPYAPMMTDLSYLPIVNEKLVTEAGDEKMATEIVPCATGPYMLAENDETHVKLVAHDKYHRGAPQIKTVNFKIIADSSTQLIAFEAGEIDLLNVPTANWASVSADDRWNTEIIAANHYSMIELNLYGKYTSNILIRKAIAHAVDPEGVNAMGYDGLAVVCNRIADPAFVFGAPEEGTIFEYDPEKAKQYLADAGYPDGLDIGEITVAGGGYYEKMAIAIQGYLETVGIHGEIVTYDSATVGNKARGNDYEILVSGHPLTSDYNFLREKWHSASNSATHNDVNDPYIDEMFDKGAAELNPEKRKEIYAELDKYLSEYCLYPTMFHKTMCYAYDKNLTFSAVPSNYYVYNLKWN